jgi:predicted dienelactone hydrolase
MKPRVITICLALGCATLPAKTRESVSIAGLNVAVWEQPAAASVPAAARPVIIFSHGFHGCYIQSDFLMTALAAAGYIVFAPNHRDATCAAGRGSWLERPALPFGQPARWDDSTYRNRAEDIRLLIAALHTDSRFADRLDWSRLALAGHSLGGYTVLGLAGAWPSWKLPEIKAVLALSPYVQPFLARGTLGGLTVPVMYQGGTRDWGITPALRGSSGAYDQTPKPKYFIEFKNATHLAWTDLGSRDRPAITAYSLGFLDDYDRGSSSSLKRLLSPDGEVTELRFSSELGSSD